MNNRELLIELIAKHNLTRQDVAELVKAKRDTIDRWLLPHESNHHLDVPDMAIELIAMKLHFGELPREPKS